MQISRPLQRAYLVMEPEHKCVSCVSFHLIERIQCYRNTLHGQSSGTRIYRKDQKVCQGFTLSSSHFNWQKQTDKLRFQLHFSYIVVLKNPFLDIIKNVLFSLKRDFSYLEHILEPSKQGHWERFRLSKPLTDKTSVVFELWLLCKKLL